MKRRPAASPAAPTRSSNAPPERERLEVVVPGGTPVDRAWARVALECPDRAGASEHRHGARVHVAPLGCGDDVRCCAGEPVPSYPGFFRPRGGFVPLVPTGTSAGEVGGPDAKVVTVPARKTRVYVAAEMAGR